MRFTILTLGCKTNQAESDLIASELINLGYKPVDLDGNPDLCIINTCTVTSKSDYQSRQLIRRATKTGARVIVTGCYAQVNESVIRNINPDALVFKNEQKLNIINILNNKSSSCLLNYNSRPLYRSRPVLKIQDGCNKSCSYCIIPMVRGRSRSIEPGVIVKRIREFEEMGYNEVVLTGINLGSYGRDLNPVKRLEELLEEILSSTERLRIRLSSLGVTEITEELINLIEKSGRICRHLHISLQSGDRGILNRMNRHYTPERFIELSEYLKKRIKDINIGADIIVGFPGEGEREFQNTFNCIKKAWIGYLHVFPFSKRPGTRAWNMPDQIDQQTKDTRLRILKELDRELRTSFYRSQVGNILRIIVEEISERTLQGKSDNYIDVAAEIPYGISVKKGMALDVHIKEASERGVRGEVILS